MSTAALVFLTSALLTIKKEIDELRVFHYGSDALYSEFRS